MVLIDKTYKFQPQVIDDKYADTPQYSVNSIDYNADDLLMSANILSEEAYSYKDKLIEALEVVSHEPLIKKIYIATINMDSGEPLFIIWAYTSSGTPASREFNFKLNDKGDIFQIK